MNQFFNKIIILLCIFLIFLPSSNKLVKAEQDENELTHSWTQMLEESKPGFFDNSEFEYNSLMKKTLLYGGSTDRFWSYDYSMNLWSQILSSNGPSPRSYMGMAVDDNTGKVYIFGGRDNKGSLGDLWSFDTKTMVWEQINSTLQPTPRHGVNFEYSTRSNLFFLQGGINENQIIDDYWTFDPQTNIWTNVTISPAWQSSHSTAFTYVEHKNSFVTIDRTLSGNNVFREYSISETTDRLVTRREFTAGIIKRESSGIEYYPPLELVLMFGGTRSHNARGGDYIYNAATELLDVDTEESRQYYQIEPARRIRQLMAYDTANKVLLLYGGQAHIIENEKTVGITDLWAFGLFPILYSSSEDTTNSNESIVVVDWRVFMIGIFLVRKSVHKSSRSID